MTKGTIVIDIRTRERLKRLGKKGQTYDDIIAELMKLNSKEPLLTRQTTHPERTAPVEDM